VPIVEQLALEPPGGGILTPKRPLLTNWLSISSCVRLLSSFDFYSGKKPQTLRDKPLKTMKLRLVFFLALVSLALASCSDDEKQVKGDPDLTHSGEKWTIASIQYTLVDQSTSGGLGQTFKTGSNATGFFYFVDGESRGSFEISVEGYNKEDFFNYTINGEDISVIQVDQSVSGLKTNQNVFALTGSATDTERTLNGTIIKQSTSGQFTLALEVVLTKP
jgi:hypothetical protein